MTHPEAFARLQTQALLPTPSAGVCGLKVGWEGLGLRFLSQSEGMQKAGRCSPAHAPTKDRNLSLH